MMAKCYFWITTSPGSAAFLYREHTLERHAGYLASLASYYQKHLASFSKIRGQHRCGTQMQRSCMLHPTLHRKHLLQDFGVGNIFGSNATAIPGADTSAALVVKVG